MSTHADESSPDPSVVEGLGLPVQREEQREEQPEPASSPSVTAWVFRLPGSGDPSPPTTRLVAMCAWATGLGLVGLLMATRAVLALWRGDPPTWYEPSFVVAGLAGIGLTVGAFMSIQRRRLPWIMLTLATIPLIASIMLTLRVA